MNDVAAFLARAIAAGRGKAPADLVLKGGRIFDLVSGESRRRRRHCGDRIVGTLADYRGAREIDVSRPDRRSRLHRHASARRNAR